MKKEGEEIMKFKCCECLEEFDETTEQERCPFCQSHHVIEEE